MKKISLKINRGFTLIETLVALSIFSASIVGLISVTASGVANTNFAKNKFIATYLAQEGVELVRNIRDNAALLPSGGGWSKFSSDIAACTASIGCTIDPWTLSVSSCGANNQVSCPMLYYDAQGFYTYQQKFGSVPTLFKRTIVVDDLGGSDHEAKVTSTISWTQGVIPHSLSYSENLFDWIQ